MYYYFLEDGVTDLLRNVPGYLLFSWKAFFHYCSSAGSGYITTLRWDNSFN